VISFDLRAVLRKWGWMLPVLFASLGILLALITDDHRLASRSAAVLLLACALIPVQDWVR
jgi:hypothetical protein